MSDPKTDSIRRSSEGGVAASHPPFENEPTLLAPAERNTLRMAIFPVACWRLDDVRFEFDSSFIRPEAILELQHLGDLIQHHPSAPLSVFGHADPTGNDEYNKQLAGRRATTIYGLLTRDIKLWRTLHDTPFGGDNWHSKSIANTIRATVGASSGSPPDLFPAYMDKICVDQTGKPFQLKKSDFLAQGTDAKGKGDYQGCGEFNPVLLFSQGENAAFSDPELKAQRDLENAPNRRVVVFLFRPGSKVSATRWPCPRANEGTGDCRKRFWSDGEKRRAPTSERRRYEVSQNTFACRFYDRIARGSPCERGQSDAVCFVFLKLLDDSAETVLANTNYTLRGQNTGFTLKDKTGDDGLIRHQLLPDDQFFVECNGITEPVPLYFMEATARYPNPWFLRLRGFEAGTGARSNIA